MYPFLARRKRTAFPEFRAFWFVRVDVSGMAHTNRVRESVTTREITKVSTAHLEVQKASLLLNYSTTVVCSFFSLYSSKIRLREGGALRNFFLIYIYRALEPTSI